jgi:hypothetical protein
MSREPTLAYTVHLNGRIYGTGMTAEDIGPDAAGIGAHAWEGGVAPTNVPGADAPQGGQQAHTPPVPTHSALGTVTPPATAGGSDNPGDGGDDPAVPGAEAGHDSNATRAGRGRRTGS